MGQYVFGGCTGLTDIFCEAERQPIMWFDSWHDNCPATVHWNFHIIIGDIDGDGIIEDGDVSAVLGSIKCLGAPMTAAQILAADFNKDGVLDIRDFNYIYSIIQKNQG